MSENPNIEHDDQSLNKAVCIDTKRIFDSCVSKDCLEDLRVTFFSKSQKLIDDAITVKCRECVIHSVAIDVEEVPFNRGYFSVDITFYFRLSFDTFKAPCTSPEVAIGFAEFTKKCILFGSDGDVKIFTSSPMNEDKDCPEAPQHSNPTAKVQTVDPVILSCDVVDCCECRIATCSSFPSSVMETVGDTLTNGGSKKAVLVTLGLFSIVQMERDVQLLIPAFDYCIPKRECVCNTLNPCDTFKTIDFPIDEFFPPERSSNDNCCCNDDDE